MIGTVTANAARGARELQVSATAGVKVGDWVRIIQTDKAGSLFRALYGGMHPGNVCEDGGTEVFRFYSQGDRGGGEQHHPGAPPAVPGGHQLDPDGAAR